MKTEQRMLINGNIYTPSGFLSRIEEAEKRTHKTIEDMELYDWCISMVDGFKEKKPDQKLYEKISLVIHPIKRYIPRLQGRDIPKEDFESWSAIFDSLDKSNEAEIELDFPDGEIDIKMLDFKKYFIFIINSKRYFAFEREEKGNLTNEDILTVFYNFQAVAYNILKEGKDLMELEVGTAPIEHLHSVLDEYKVETGIKYELK